MGFVRFYEAVSLGMVMPPSMMNVTFALGPFSLSASCSALEALDFLRKGNWGAYGDELRQMDDILRSFENRK
jgi:ABC-type microcin C transport system permease subunit YejE